MKSLSFTSANSGNPPENINSSKTFDNSFSCNENGFKFISLNDKNSLKERDSILNSNILPAKLSLDFFLIKRDSDPEIIILKLAYKSYSRFICSSQLSTF